MNLILTPHFTPAKRAGDFVFVSGQLPFGEDGSIISGDIFVQTRHALALIEKALATADASLSDIVKVMVWLTSPDLFADFNRTYAKYFPALPPARATVCSALMVPGALVEMEAVAYTGAC